MKIQFLKEHANGPGMVYPVGSVITTDEQSGNALIAQGIAAQVDDNVAPKLQPELYDMCRPLDVPTPAAKPKIEEKNAFKNRLKD